MGTRDAVTRLRDFIGAKRGLPPSLVFVALLPCLLDGILTLIGQAPSYWLKHAFVNEADALGHYLLTVGPYAFVFALIAWAALLGLAMWRLPVRFSLPLWLWVFVTHMSGSSSWVRAILERRIGASAGVACYATYSYQAAACILASYVAYRSILKGSTRPEGADVRRPCDLALASAVGVATVFFLLTPVMFGRLTFRTAAAYGDLSRAAALLKKDPSLVRAADENGETLLHLLARQGQEEAARFLLDHNADVNARSDYGRTPLHEAALHGKRPLARLLLARGADPNVQDDGGFTPFHDAVARGGVRLVRLLATKGADLDVVGGFISTPLQHAAQTGRCDLAAVLLKNGANPSLTDEGGNAPLHYASEGGHRYLAEMLLDHGAEIGAQTVTGWTALHFAAARGHKDVAELLIRRGSDVNARDKDGKTPLELAEERGHQEVAEFLRWQRGKKR